MDTVGRIGFWAQDTAYKLCTIKTSKKDGSIYVGFNFGTQHVDRGISGYKITYHPDGNTWLTADLQEKIVGKDFIEEASTTHMVGLAFGLKGHVYVKGENYELQPSFDEIEAERLVVRIKSGAEYFDIHRKADYDSYFARETKVEKINMTDMVIGSGYFGLRIDFFLAVNSRVAEFADAVDRKGGLKLFKYPHPSRNITILATIKNTTKQPKNTG